MWWKWRHADRWEQVSSTVEWSWNFGRSSLWRKWLNGATIPWLEHKSICWTRGKCFVLCHERKGRNFCVPCGPFFRFFLVPSSPFIALEHGGWCAFHEARRNPPRMEHLPHTGRKTFDLPTFKWRWNFKIFLRFWNNFFCFCFWNNVTALQREHMEQCRPHLRGISGINLRRLMIYLRTMTSQ